MTDDERAFDELYALLPAVYRTRDVEEQRGEPLRHLLQVLGEEAAIVEENLTQLYDDMFVETASPWVLPYIAELIGLRGLPSASTGMTPRAEVANTIGYRRRKGTAAVLEQLARDVTGWPARAVEYFELLVGLQHMNHIRPRNLGMVNIRDAHRLEWVGSPFERRTGHTDLPHVLDVRRIPTRRGRYSIPNIGIHVWRLRPYALTMSPAVPLQAGDQRRYFFHPLAVNTQLFTLPITEDEISQLAEPINVPLPISRSMFRGNIATYYGPGRSVNIFGIDQDDIIICHLGDTPVGWAHTPPPAGKVAIDPVLGRMAFPDDQDKPPLANFHYGFSANIGGGQYNRIGSIHDVTPPVVRVSQLDPAALFTTITGGLGELGAEAGTVEIDDSGRYDELPTQVVNGRRVEVRSTNQNRATLILRGEGAVPPPIEDWIIEGNDEGELILNGLLIAGGRITVRGLRRLRLRHCTLVPGISLQTNGDSEHPGEPSLVVESPETEVELDSCVIGGVRIHVDAGFSAINSIIDAGSEGIAYSSLDGTAAGGTLTLDQCTVLGKVHARVIERASNTIFLAAVTAEDNPADWPGPVLADRKQTGCIRFSYLPAGSRTPRRYRCQPERDADADRLRPVLTSSRYSDPGYCQLDRRTPDAIYRGADDESEMGVLHDLYQAQREHYLKSRLDDYLRFGLEAGIFFAS